MAKWVCNLTWEDAKYLTPEAKKELLASYSPHERDARSKGIPQLGSGAIYPICEDDITIKPFELPAHWPRVYALDPGWKNKTAAIWGTYDRKSDCWYMYSEYYRGYAEPSIHADAIKAHGKWMNGVIDTAANSASVSDGNTLLQLYTDLGLNLYPANKSVEAGILEVYQRLSSGRLKIFTHLLNTLTEIRVYRRDENGRVAQKQQDDLMDAMRYLIMSGMQVMELPPSEDNDDPERQVSRPRQGNSKICGY